VVLPESEFRRLSASLGSGLRVSQVTNVAHKNEWTARLARLEFRATFGVRLIWSLCNMSKHVLLVSDSAPLCATFAKKLTLPLLVPVLAWEYLNLWPLSAHRKIIYYANIYKICLLDLGLNTLIICRASALALRPAPSIFLGPELLPSSCKPLPLGRNFHGPLHTLARAWYSLSLSSVPKILCHHRMSREVRESHVVKSWCSPPSR